MGIIIAAFGISAVVWMGTNNPVLTIGAFFLTFILSMFKKA